MDNRTERINVIYGNWLVLHPQGFEMFRCTTKRAEWYLSRKLAEVVKKNPPTIKLTFIPAGKGWHGDKFSLTPKENKCVVCGTIELNRLTKHHIVPSLYKKYFPKKLKVSASHDVVCICRECHDEYENIYAIKLKQKISDTYKIPLCNSHSNFIKAVKLAKAYVLNKEFMPKKRKEEMILMISENMGYEKKTISFNKLKALSKVDRKKYTEIYDNHGKQIVMKITDIQAFVELWRNDFVENMSPKFMPKHWSVCRPISK